MDYVSAGGGQPGVTSPFWLPQSYFAGVPANSQVVFRWEVPIAMTIPALLAGSNISAGIAATAEAIFAVARNGNANGTVTWAAAGTVPTVAGVAEMVCAAGDVITITGPADNDATLANISATIFGRAYLGGATPA